MDRAVLAVVIAVAVAALPACSGVSPEVAPASFESRTEPTTSASAAPDTSREGSERGPSTSAGTPRRALLSVPALGIGTLPVVPYVGRTDDAPGTNIQDRGLAASPHGPEGGTGPGGLGNYQVTAHRLASTQAFLELPSLRVGQRAHVVAGDVRYIYEIRETRRTSFRSPESLAEQRAAVPGKPGANPQRAFITLSTCATPEDHAKGNYWADQFGNPEHRIDKIGVLVRTETADQP